MPENCDCALALFPVLPANHKLYWASKMIDDVTGGYGFAHIGIECCRPDAPPAIIHASYEARKIEWQCLEHWAKVPYGRVSLKQLVLDDIDCTSICNSAVNLLNKPYSLERVKHVLPEELRKRQDMLPEQGYFCGDLVVHSLPSALVSRLSTWLQLNVCYPPAIAGIGLDAMPFISPNGFARALGLPPAKEIKDPAQ